jgi:DNA-binding NarL/FixJ family response regulator
MFQLQSIPSQHFALPGSHDGDEFSVRPGTQASRPEGSTKEGAKENAKEGVAGVLIVEDDFLIGMQTESALMDAGIDVVGIASTAEEAVLLARQYEPVLAVMDIRLAGQRDGIEAAGELFRELGVRCIFATSHDDQGMRSRAAPFAPLGWLAKPYTMASLIALVRQSIAAR